MLGVEESTQINVPRGGKSANSGPYPTHIAPVSVTGAGESTQVNVRRRHIALVGITGVGKSTLVNVLQGTGVARVSNDANPCTMEATRYEVVESGTTYSVWDTRGLNEGLEGKTTFYQRLLRRRPAAEQELEKLLRGSNPKFDLVLLCVDAKKIKVSAHWKIYNLVHDDICKKKLKVAVVVTQAEEDQTWQTICENAAKDVVEEFPDRSLRVAVPKFDKLGDHAVKKCKHRILSLIADACP